VEKHLISEKSDLIMIRCKPDAKKKPSLTRMAASEGNKVGKSGEVALE
jgi:hypothetical protein